jgi:hypothetical protein
MVCRLKENDASLTQALPISTHPLCDACNARFEGAKSNPPISLTGYRQQPEAANFALGAGGVLTQGEMRLIQSDIAVFRNPHPRLQADQDTAGSGPFNQEVF